MTLLNKTAPAFFLLDQEGSTHSLSDYRGQKVLLYFYPKDDTPGCTTEAKCFRDRLNELSAANVRVFGVSADDSLSHAKFSEKHGLNFPLLADVDKEVVQAYGVWVEKSMFGKKYMGIQRDSFLINEEGVVVKHYEKVTPATHVDEVMHDVTSGELF
jgi:thioredoxin-dependent peroxiredoxin